MAVQYLPIDWKIYHSLAQNLATAILAKNEHPDEIVAISRGGLTLGHLLTDLLRIPISTISIQSYTDIQASGEVKIALPLQKSIEGKHVLLADDVSDSGKTLIRAIDHLKESYPKKITTVTMFYKPHSIFKPDYFAKKTSRWILFPYEPAEMILGITQHMKKEGKTKAEIKKFLKKLDYNDTQIAFVWKHHLP